MMLFKDISPTFTKNPLGIIALFIVLVYGIAGSTAAFAGFNEAQLWAVIGFMVSFPVLVLFVFYLLVTRHSDKIYGPADFADDASFMQYIGVLQTSPAEAGRNLKEWVDQSVENRRELQNWLRRGGIGYSVTSFLLTGTPELHDAAYRELVSRASGVAASAG